MYLILRIGPFVAAEWYFGYGHSIPDCNIGWFGTLGVGSWCITSWNIIFISIFFRTPKICLFDTEGYLCGCIMCLVLYFGQKTSPFRYGSQNVKPMLEIFVNTGPTIFIRSCYATMIEILINKLYKRLHFTNFYGKLVIISMCIHYMIFLFDYEGNYVYIGFILNSHPIMLSTVARRQFSNYEDSILCNEHLCWLEWIKPISLDRFFIFTSHYSSSHNGP